MTGFFWPTESTERRTPLWLFSPVYADLLAKSKWSSRALRRSWQKDKLSLRRRGPLALNGKMMSFFCSPSDFHSKTVFSAFPVFFFLQLPAITDLFATLLENLRSKVPDGWRSPVACLLLLVFNRLSSFQDHSTRSERSGGSGTSYLASIPPWLIGSANIFYSFFLLSMTSFRLPFFLSRCKRKPRSIVIHLNTLIVHKNSFFHWFDTFQGVFGFSPLPSPSAEKEEAAVVFTKQNRRRRLSEATSTSVNRALRRILPVIKASAALATHAAQ